MKKTVPNLVKKQEIFIASKEKILLTWLSYETPKEILHLHQIPPSYFIDNYAGGVFDYFMGVIAGDVEIGNCPVMQGLLIYLKDREISADELFEICSHFRQAMVDFSYDSGLNSKELFDEISYIFDKNFRGILKYYTDTIFQKLIDARMEALRASKAKEYFLSNMSHEIRTPLNAIIGFVNLLRDETVSKKHRNYLDIIHNSGENLLSIINDILDFSKLRSGEFTIEPKIFSLHQELSQTMELFVASATTKNITITSFIDPNISKELYADALRIKQILSNFLSNAIKFTPEGGVIQVEVSCDSNILKISVHDSGIGIAKEDIKNIFTAFTQAQYSELKNCDGTGLGLSICHQLAQHMGGSVDVSSEVDNGSRFWVNIPVEVHTQESEIFEHLEEFKGLKMIVYTPDNQIGEVYASFIRYATIFGMDVEVRDNLNSEFDLAIFVHEDADKVFLEQIIDSDKKFIALMRRYSENYEQFPHIKSLCFPIYCSKIIDTLTELLHPEATLTYKHEIGHKFIGHILIAEDNEANQELIKILLTKYGLSFDLAVNGLQAVNLYKKSRYDLILMDEQMPIMDGNEAVGEILKYEKSTKMKHTPVSALTANVIKGAKERGLSSGFDSFLGKPVVLKDLERVFMMYLKVDSNNRVDSSIQKIAKSKIQGLNVEKLKEDLMLNQEELTMLLSLFIKKMTKTIPELQNAIRSRDFKKIGLLAHSIKGSSGNFRIEVLQTTASKMEKMAKVQSQEYDYEGNFKILQEKTKEIKIS